jgi:hypothetical protein
MDKERKINILCFIILTGFVLAIIIHYVAGFYLGYGYPYNTFLFRPWDRWTDFVNTFTISSNPYKAASPEFIYFPFLYKIVTIFTFIPLKTAEIVYLMICILSFTAICYKQLRTEKLSSPECFIIIPFLTYPFLIALDRANFEFVVFFCSYLFVFWYKKHPFWSAIFLGFAIALKAFPVILAVLLLADRKYKEIAIAALVSILASLFSYATLPGGLGENISLHLRNLQLYTQSYAVGLEGLYFGNSLWGGIKFISILTNIKMMSTLTYDILIVLGLLSIAIYVVFIEKTFWKRAALLICALNLFPQVSGDYKLLYIFIPLFLFINQTDHEKLDWSYLILFGLLLIPKDYYHLPVYPEASLSVLLNPLLMLTLVTLIISSGLVCFFRNRLSRTTTFFDSQLQGVH